MTKASKTIRKIAGDVTIDAALVLGSGLSALGDELKDKVTIPFSELKGFPGGGVSGHGRDLLIGTMGGKRLAKRTSEIAVQFRRTPHLVFRRNPEAIAEAGNRLILRIQPDEGIALQFGAKLPGPEPRIKAVEMDFDYNQTFGSEPPEAYERLLLDAMKGDATLYARGDWVDLAWELLEPVLQAWGHGDPRKFPNYEAGTWGTTEADTLIERDGRAWRGP